MVILAPAPPTTLAVRLVVGSLGSTPDTSVRWNRSINLSRGVIVMVNGSLFADHPEQGAAVLFAWA